MNAEQDIDDSCVLQSMSGNTDKHCIGDGIHINNSEQQPRGWQVLLLLLLQQSRETCFELRAMFNSHTCCGSSSYSQLL